MEHCRGGWHNANGVGYRYGFSDGATVITLNLNVPIVKGSYYIGWLTQEDSTKEWIKWVTSLPCSMMPVTVWKLKTKADITAYKSGDYSGANAISGSTGKPLPPAL